jgi:putative chitinase
MANSPTVRCGTFRPCPWSGMVDLAKFAAALPKLWPHGDSVVPGLIAGTIASAPSVFQKYGITTDLVVAHAFAQFSEECGCGLEMMEDMNYSAARLLQVFPSHFTHSDAIALQHQPRLIADQAYGGRMGNRPRPYDDGFNFRGQGFSQLTGRDNYVALSKTTGLDLVNHPELIRDPAHALECGIGDFVQCGCLPYAEKDMLIGVSSMLNVGHYVSDPNKINGYSMRKNWLGLWKHALGVA